MGTFKKFNFHGVDIPVEVPENVIAEAVQKYLEEHPIEVVTDEHINSLIDAKVGANAIVTKNELL